MYIFLFPKLKMSLKGKGFTTVEKIQKKTEKAQGMMTKDDYRT